MSVYVTDTHSLVWYATNKYSSLSKKALAVFQQADNGEALIYVPTIVFWEIAILDRLGKISLQEGFDKWSTSLLNQSGFAEAIFDLSIIKEAAAHNFNDDIFDSAIVFTAKNLDFPLITKDVAITEANLVETFW
jgi:PIN domain nuclease of toxin-antitoxin system